MKQFKEKFRQPEVFMAEGDAISIYKLEPTAKHIAWVKHKEQEIETNPPKEPSKIEKSSGKIL